MDLPRLYLIAPHDLTTDTAEARLGPVLDAAEVSALRLDLSGRPEGEVTRAADAVRELVHVRDIPVVIVDHVAVADRLGLDGVHLTDGRAVREARKALGPDAIVGAHCGASRHDGILAGEAGAEYVAFGPVGETALGAGERAEGELFEWWAQMIEVPVVAEGALGPSELAALAPHADFVAIGPEIWSDGDPAHALRRLLDAMGGQG